MSLERVGQCMHTFESASPIRSRDSPYRLFNSRTDKVGGGATAAGKRGELRRARAEAATLQENIARPRRWIVGSRSSRSGRRRPPGRTRSARVKSASSRGGSSSCEKTADVCFAFCFLASFCTRSYTTFWRRFVTPRAFVCKKCERELLKTARDRTPAIRSKRAHRPPS